MLMGVVVSDCAPSRLAPASVVLRGDRDKGGLEVWALAVADIDCTQLDRSVLDPEESRRAASLAQSADRLS